MIFGLTKRYNREIIYDEGESYDQERNIHEKNSTIY